MTGMDGQNVAPEAAIHSSSLRPAVVFPLWTALVLLIVFFLSAAFSCCYHWEKFLRLRRLYGRGVRHPPHGDHRHRQDADPGLHSTGASPTSEGKSDPSLQDKGESFLVIMPNDRFPKFMAQPCPYEYFPSPMPEKKITMEVLMARQSSPVSIPY